MNLIRQRLGVPTFLFALLGSAIFANSAELKHYIVSASGSFGSTYGFAELNWLKDGTIEGQFCPEHFYQDSRRQPGPTTLKGRRISLGRAELRFGSQSDELDVQRLPTDLFHLMYVSEYQRSYFSGSWATNNQTLGNERLIFDRADQSTSPPPLKMQVRLYPEFKSFNFNGGLLRTSGTLENWDLSLLDAMSPDETRAFFALHVPYTQPKPAVRVFYRPDQRTNIERFLQRLSDTAKFQLQEFPTCGIPYIEQQIDVPPGLEFYFARKLQISGLVLEAQPAFPPPQPAPPFMEIEQNNLVLAGLLQYSISKGAKSRELTRVFDRWLGEALESKRPRYNALWEIIPRNSGSPLVYRRRVVGPAISECKDTGWEMFDVQIIPTSVTQTRPTILVQVVEGYEAPGTLDRRPPDTRFKDNPLNNDRLARIQDAVASYFDSNGVNQEESPEGDGARRKAACRL